MRFYQTTETEPIRRIAEKTGVSPAALSGAAGLSSRALVPGGVSLLLPAGTRGPLTAGSGIYTRVTEERAELVICREDPEKFGSTLYKGIFGMTRIPAGILGQQGITHLRPARRSGYPHPVLAPVGWTGATPYHPTLKNLLVREGYRGLLLPVRDLPGHVLTDALPDLLTVFGEAGLTLGLATSDRDFLTRCALFSSLSPQPMFYLLSPSRIGNSLEERVRDLMDLVDTPIRRRILLSLSTGATWVANQKSAPLPYGEALKLLLSSPTPPQREELLVCPMTVRGVRGVLYLEDPAALLPGLIRLEEAGIGGLSLSENRGMPFACEMISRLFKTAGETDGKRSRM